MFYYVIICKLKKKIVFLLNYNLMIKKSIKRFSFISVILLLLLIFLGGRRHKLYAQEHQIFKYGPEYSIRIKYFNWSNKFLLNFNILI
jgi:hypothetical protein